MAGITLDQAQAQLDSALTALTEARSAQSWTVRDRSKQAQQVQQLLEDVKYWQAEVKRLSVEASGYRRSRTVTAGW